jgi:hypothetical protein
MKLFHKTLTLLITSYYHKTTLQFKLVSKKKTLQFTKIINNEHSIHYDSTSFRQDNG